ncbi:MAG: zeta toxin family protein, partial [Waterburya sp.]
NYLFEQKADFAFETTLATRSFAGFLKKCQRQGYRINLIYVWLNSPELAIRRVAKRVENGGHNIPQDIIIRRYKRSLNNFFELYSPFADYWIIYNNSQSPTQVIAEKTINSPMIIYQPQVWQQFIQKRYES